MDKHQTKFFKKFGDAVKIARLAKELTLEDMQDFGFSPQHFQKIEKGKKAVGLYTAYRISKALDKTLNVLLN